MHNHSEQKDFSFGKRASSYDKGIEGRLSRRFLPDGYARKGLAQLIILKKASR